MGGAIEYPDLTKLRVEYKQRSLSEEDVDADPIAQLVLWLNEAVAAQAHEPNAMALATCTRDAIPSVRMVLLKEINQEGLSFFTNYDSRKGRELEANPQAAAVFFWPELERQVRVEGSVEHTSSAESDAYFRSRPPGSRIGAAASPQSQPVPSRHVLEQRAQELLNRYPDSNVPRPSNWGGYRLRPSRLEFWQGRPSRLHDRIEYIRHAGSNWQIRRLAP